MSLRPMDPHSVSPSEVPSPHRASEVDATARARRMVDESRERMAHYTPTERAALEGRARGAVNSPRPLPPGQDPAFTMGHHSFTPAQEAGRDSLSGAPPRGKGVTAQEANLDVAAANQGMSGSEIRERFDLAVTRMREALVQADTKARLERGIDSVLAHLSGSLLGADPDHVYVEESVSDCRAALLAALAKEGFPTT